MLWPIPVAPAQARDAARQRLIHDLLVEWISERILRIRSHPSRPFITAQWEEGHLARPLNLRGFELVAWPDSLERGLAAVLAAIERVAQHGIPAARLDHQKAVLLARLSHAATSGEGRSSQAFADAYVDHALTGEGSLLSAQQELAFAREIVATLNADTLARAARAWLVPTGTRILVGLPVFAHVRAPTRESILALLDSIVRTPLAPDSDRTVAEQSLLAKLPTPGRIVNERHDRVAGITEWTLSNGARVIIKPTQNDPDDFRIRAWSAGGFAAMPDSLFLSPGRMVGRVMTDIGGLGSMTHDALRAQLSTTGLRSMRVDIGYLDESIAIAGSPKDLETLFQLLYLQFTAPIVDSAALAGWRSLAKYQARTVPFDDEVSRELANGNARMLPVSTQVAELATVRNLMATYRDRFGDVGTFAFTLVGAVSESEARPLVERYIASIPATGAHAPAKPSESQIVVHRVNSTSKTLELPKALTLLLFDGRFPADPQDYLRERQRLSALTGILGDRLRVRLRQELSGTYSPSVTSETYALPEERYRVRIVFDAAPDRMRELNRAMMVVLDSLRTQGVSDTEAARQATVQRRQLETRLQDNDYWVTTIDTYARLGIPLDAIPAPYGTHAVTASEIQTAAQKYLPNDAYIHITQMPEDTTDAP
jgi:zinc protease